MIDPPSAVAANGQIGTINSETVLVAPGE